MLSKFRFVSAGFDNGFYTESIFEMLQFKNLSN